MIRRVLSLMACIALVYAGSTAPARGYVLNRTVGSNGGCPQLQRFRIGQNSVDRWWSTSPSSGIRTTLGIWTGSQQQAEISASIERSFQVWTNVAGTTLTPGTLAPLQTTSTRDACSFSDGRNTICFNKTDSSFTSGVLAFTRVLSALRVGETAGSKTASFVGEILDADIYFKPNDSVLTFATPGALTTSHYDLETVLTHELGHFFGFSHSSVWRAMMWPFAPPKGRFTGDRPTAQRPDAPLADDDRVGLRVLYPDVTDTLNAGIIRGRVLPANPDVAGLPAGVTGIFGAHVVAVDADTGAVVAGTFAGWTCSSADLPTRFDGSYVFERLPLGRNYKIYAEPMDGPTDAGNISNFLDSLCRSGTNNACTRPAVNTGFTTRVRPVP